MKVLVLVIIFLFFYGCGDETTSPSIENSKLTNKNSSYGYYGKNVIFGEYNVNMNWKLCGGENRETCFNLSFNDNGTIIIGNGPIITSNKGTKTNENKQNYGVSDDGNIITFDDYDNRTSKLTIKGITGHTNYFSINGGKELAYKCYNVEISDSINSTMVDMCPWGWHAL